MDACATGSGDDGNVRFFLYTWTSVSAGASLGIDEERTVDNGRVCVYTHTFCVHISFSNTYVMCTAFRDNRSNSIRLY